MSVYLGSNEVGVGVYEKPPQKPYTGFKFYNRHNSISIQVKLTRYLENQTPPNVSLLWSKDNGVTWQSYVLDTYMEIEPKERLCLMAGPTGNTRFSYPSSYNRTRWYFTTSEERGLYLEGNIMSLLTQDYETADEVPSYAFKGLFMEGNYMEKANFIRDEYSNDPLVLPAKIVNEGGYQSMFSAQYLIGSMPDLPATTVGDGAYSNMFNRSGLSGDLSGKCLPCEEPDYNAYSNMFSSNYALTHAPIVVGRESGNVGGHMFTNCWNLESVHMPNLNSFGNDPVQYCEKLKYLDIDELNFKPDLKNGYYEGQGVIAANTDFQGVYPSQYMPNGWTYVCKTTGEVLTPPN